MKRCLPLFALAFAAAGCPLPYTPPTPVDEFTKYGRVTGTKYYIYVPSYYSEDRDWPLVITLHGSLMWDGPLRQVKEWKYYAEKHGAIVIAPSLGSAEGILPAFNWEGRLRKDERNVLAILDEVCTDYRIDRKAVLLTGFSAGGYPMYYIGLRNPDRFNMLISRGGNSSMRIFDKLELSKSARKLPIMIFWGKDDKFTHRDGWRAFRWLRQNGVKTARMKKVKGGHLRRPDTAYYYWRPYLPKRHRMER